MNTNNNAPIGLIQKINEVLKSNEIQTISEAPLPNLQDDFDA